MHMPHETMKGCLFSNNYDNSIITGPIALNLYMHEGVYLAMYTISMCHNWGATARAHVQVSFPDLENG